MNLIKKVKEFIYDILDVVDKQDYVFISNQLDYIKEQNGLLLNTVTTKNMEILKLNDAIRKTNTTIEDNQRLINTLTKFIESQGLEAPEAKITIEQNPEVEIYIDDKLVIGNSFNTKIGSIITVYAKAKDPKKQDNVKIDITKEE